MEVTARKSHQGANVRRWREWRNINQDTLAEQIGVSQTALSGYEKKEKLEPEIVAKIAKALEIPVEAITEIEEATAINIFSGNWHDNSVAQNYQPTFNPLDKMIELYERMLKDKDEAIALLHDLLKSKK